MMSNKETIKKRVELHERTMEHSTIGQMKVHGFIEGDDPFLNRLRRRISMRGYSPSTTCVLFGHEWTESDKYDYHDAEECSRSGCEGTKIVAVDTYDS